MRKYFAPRILGECHPGEGEGVHHFQLIRWILVEENYLNGNYGGYLGFQKVVVVN